jgi:hypothetical protein
MDGSKGLSGVRFAQATIEVRHEKAHRYWDDSGKLVAAIESRLPGVECQRLGPNGFEFTGAISSACFSSATFFWDRISVTATDPAAVSMPKRFAENAAEFIRLVCFGIGVSRFSRVGHRLWHYLPFENTAAASEWLEKRGVWSPGVACRDWGTQSNEQFRAQFVIDPDRSVVLRLGSASMTRPAPQPIFGVFVDADFFTTHPSSIDVLTFAKNNLRFLDQRLDSLLSE